MDTKTKQVEILPLIKFYMDELGLARVFDKYVPNTNGMEIAPAQVLCMMVMNIMVSAKPLYRVEDWLHDYLDGVTERRFEAEKYNDDRLGRNLDLLFDANRPSLMTDLSANAFGCTDWKRGRCIMIRPGRENLTWMQQGPQASRYLVSNSQYEREVE